VSCKRGQEQGAVLLPATAESWAKIGVFTGLIMGQILPQRFIDMVLPAVFRDAGVALTDFWIFSLAAAPYWFKWLWAPYVDTIGSDRIGRRKSVIIPCTLAGAIVYSTLCFAEPSPTWVTPVVLILFMAALVMSIQDVAVDGYTVEGLDRKDLGAASAIFSVGARFADILSVGGLLVVYELFGWRATMVTAAVLLVIFSLPAFLRREPSPPQLKKVLIASNQRASLRRFLRRKDTPYVLGLVICLTFAIFLVPVMLATFLRDLGFRWSEIALAIGVTQAVGSIAGGLLGSWLLSRFAFTKGARVAAILAMIAPFGYLALSLDNDPDLTSTLMAIVIFVTLYSPLFVVQSAARYRWASKAQAGTDYTIQSSCFFLGLSAALAFGGAVAGILGWTAFFAISAGVLAVVGLAFSSLVDRVNSLAEMRDRELTHSLTVEPHSMSDVTQRSRVEV